jgi:hypothetical protein
MFLGGKPRSFELSMGLMALSLVACANRFPKNRDPVEDYYSSRPRYKETPETSTSQRPGAAAAPSTVGNHGADTASEMLDEGDVPAGQGSTHGAGGGSSGTGLLPTTKPDATVASDTTASQKKPGGAVAVSGGGRFKNFGKSEAAQIRDTIFGSSKIAQFGDFEPMIDRMMDHRRWPAEVYTVSKKTESLIKVPFNMNDKAFCEDFTLEDTGIRSFYKNNSTLRKRWEGEDGKAAIDEMKRVNRAYNQIQRDYKAAIAGKDNKRAEALNNENLAFWKTFMSCLAYSESGIFWDKPDSKKWLSNWNDYGIYQFNPAQKNGGNINDCVKNWNEEFPNDKIDETKFRANEAYRKAIVTTKSQHFNMFCGVSKIQQNLAHQASRNEGCLNPFKKSYNHFGALMQNSDFNFLRCTSKLIPSAGSATSQTQALMNLRSSGSSTAKEATKTH